MATSGSYFLNAPSLGSATAVFTDTDLSICAANGFYSDGVIVREQVDCVLLPQQTCAACPPPPPPTIFVAAVRLQGDGADCSSSSSDPFSAVAYIASDYADFVLNGAGRLVLDNTTGISFGGLETQLYDPNDANVDIVAESITSSLSGLILGDSIYNTLVNDESVLDTGSPKVTSSVSNIGTIQFSLCPS
jgi:hypothetical protein